VAVKRAAFIMVLRKKGLLSRLLCSDCQEKIQDFVSLRVTQPPVDAFTDRRWERRHVLFALDGFCDDRTVYSRSIPLLAFWHE
jgi:hypothetical protein